MVRPHWKYIDRLLWLWTLVSGRFSLYQPILVFFNDFFSTCSVVTTERRFPYALMSPPLIDLAALTSGNWSLEDRAAMIVAYRSERRQVDANGRGDDSLEMNLKYCRLHLAIQWLGWAYPWTPPSEQDHDWLGEATRLYDELRWPS